MNESTAQNSHKPIEPAALRRPTDHFAEEMLRPLVEHEVARQLSGGKSAKVELILREVAWAAALITLGYLLAGWLS